MRYWFSAWAVCSLSPAQTRRSDGASAVREVSGRLGGRGMTQGGCSGEAWWKVASRKNRSRPGPDSSCAPGGGVLLEAARRRPEGGEAGGAGGTDQGYKLFLESYILQHAGVLDQLVDRSLCMREVPGSKPGYSILLGTRRLLPLHPLRARRRTPARTPQPSTAPSPLAAREARFAIPPVLAQ
jgi:hypothetical protein